MRNKRTVQKRTSSVSTNHHSKTGNNQHNKNIKKHITSHKSLQPKYSCHPFEIAISRDQRKYIHSTYTAATLNPQSRIVLTNGTLSHHASNKSFADLIKYNSPIDDSIIFIYLTILRKHYPDIYPLDTNFHRDLRIHGWNHAYTTYFYNEQRPRGRTQRNILKPTLNSSSIIIPNHIYNSHWIMLCQRVIGQQTFFLYADDLNSKNTEGSIKSQYSNNLTDSSFHLPDSIWINCLSFTYHPHSNECGPRSLIAATVLGLHPFPSPHILLPYMHPNIAQLSRWWVAKCIITDIFDPAPFNSSSTPPTNDPPTSLLQEAAPYDLYPEEGDQLSQHTGTLSFSDTTQDTYSQIPGLNT